MSLKSVAFILMAGLSTYSLLPRLRSARKKVEYRIKRVWCYMKKRRWKNEEKFRIVLEGFFGRA